MRTGWEGTLLLLGLLVRPAAGALVFPPPPETLPRLEWVSESLPGIGSETPSTPQLSRDLAALREVLETRLAAVDKALAQLATVAERLPAQMEARIEQLQALQAERSRSVELQFQAGRAALATAIDAAEKSHAEKTALQALAISKAEAAVAEQLRGMNTTMQDADRRLQSQTATLKERLDRMEGESSGISSGWGALLGIIGAVGILSGLVMALRRGDRPRPPP